MITLTLVLIIMTGLISYQAFSDRQTADSFIFYPALMKQSGQWHRFITSGFIHADMGHLLLNMFVLFQFGQFVEGLFSHLFGAMLSKAAFILFYLSAIVAANIPTYLRHQDDPSYRALGASGATSAMVFSYILFAPWDWFLFPPMPAILLGVGYLWYSSYMDKRGGDNIGHNAHFWGAVYGVVVTLVAVQIAKPEMMGLIIDRFLEGPKLPPFLSGGY